MTRTLPVRVEPVAGESLTSWLCAYAHRNDVTWEQMLIAVGLHCRRGDMKRLGWAAQLQPHEIEKLSTATGVNAVALRDMTLTRFEALGITTGRRPPNPDFGALPGPARPLRYCARCLDGTGGRWQLRWSLGWTFVCLEHECLLADTCPHCLRRPQRAAPLVKVVPDLTTCGQPGGSGTPTSVCGADLTRAVRAVTTDAALEAQRLIDQVIDGDASGWPIYGANVISSRQVLADLRALARRVAASWHDEQPTAEPGYQGGTASDLMPSDTPAAVQHGTYRTAMGFTAAVATLQSPTVETGARILRAHLVNAPVERSSSDFARSAAYGRRTTPVLAGLQLSALGPRLSAIDQLRYRVGTERPHAPRRPAATLAKVTRALPTLIWPDSATRLLDHDGADPVVRAALSCAVALVGTEAPLHAIASLLAIDVDSSLLRRTLQRMTTGQNRIRVLRGVTSLADHIAVNPVAVDYHRRRQLDYSTLVPSAEWRSIRRILDTDAVRNCDVDVARCVLFERISGLPMSRSPWFAGDREFRSACNGFVGESTPALDSRLEQCAEDFLVAQCIADEPVMVTPPWVTDAP